MVSREHLLAAIVHEVDVCKHLFTKIPEGGFDYRPSEKQRSTLELLRYLALCGIEPIKAMNMGDWSEYSKREKELENMTPAEFPELMTQQAEELRTLLTTTTDEDLQTKIVKAPGAGELPLGTAILRTSYAWLVAYRHELFLRAKATGNQEINTANNWGGVDWKPKEKVEETEA